MINPAKKQTNLNEVGLSNQYIIIITAVIVAFVIFISGLYIGKNIQKKRMEYLSGKNIVYQTGEILEGISNYTDTAYIDYDRQIAIGSPLIFGGAHAPDLNQQKVWDQLKEVGVTSIRRDLFIEGELPKDITLEDYINNKGDVRNTDKWNKDAINQRNEILKNAKSRGMKNISIFSYTPAWLTYSKTIYGVPKNWEVYEDIIKKIYRLHRIYIDYAEIWNEPNVLTFLDTKNSGLSPDIAYSLIYYHSAKAIKEVDIEINDGKFTPIGGPASSKVNDVYILKKLLEKLPDKNLLNFISYHNYSDSNDTDLSLIYKTLDLYKYRDLPIFITEWNSGDKSELKNMYRTGQESISFTGNKLISYLKNGVADANYYAMLDLNRPQYLLDDKTMGFYLWKNNTSYLLPQSKTWNIMSNTLGLGKNESKIVETETGSLITGTGFINGLGQYGMVFSNKNLTQITVTVSIKNLILKNNIRVNAYEASSTDNGSKIVGTLVLNNNNGEKQVKIVIPGNSLIGIIFESI